MSIEAGLCKYAELNDKIKQELRTKKKVTITAVNGQRYIGCRQQLLPERRFHHRHNGIDRFRYPRDRR